MIAYDFETTRIQAGTPTPLYLTAYAGGQRGFSFEGRLKSVAHLHDVLIDHFLIEETRGAKFCAWNGNNFDAYFIAAAMVCDPNYVIRPYLTNSMSIRGLRIIEAKDVHNEKARGWEFLDGIAMTGLAGTNLEKFLKNFAPDHLKLTGVINFETEEFDPDNIEHCNYAMRDSVGLWHGLTRAQQIMMENFDQPLAVTMGGACIKIFATHIPQGIEIHTPRDDVQDLIRSHVMRGGFCYNVTRYQGPIWKYDINQAYAAAMREACLPCGVTQRVHGKPPPGKPAIIRLSGENRKNKIPFYYRADHDGHLRSCFDSTHIRQTWVTSIEYEQLLSEGWQLNVIESYYWSDSFNMKDFVDKLERTRMTCAGGPSGPIGTMIKATGNHSYGKTVEQIQPLEYVLAGECPDGYIPFYGDELEPIEHVFVRYVPDQQAKAYHQPQLGAFITAHVRMVLRRAALLDPDAWLYADTDCVVFSCDVTDRLDIDAKRYGAWKIEESGTEYRMIAKKVYASLDGDKRSAKGMHVRKLTPQDFAEWFDGEPPKQLQTQRNNFLIVMRGAEMYRSQLRTGTAV